MAKLDSGIKPSGFESCVACVNFRSSVILARTLACRQQKQAQLTAAKDTGLHQRMEVTLRISLRISSVQMRVSWSKDSRQSLRDEEASQDSRVKVPGEHIQA